MSDFAPPGAGPKRFSLSTALSSFFLVGAIVYYFWPQPSMPQSAPVDARSYQSQTLVWEECTSAAFIDEDQFDPHFNKADVLCAAIKVPASYDVAFGSDLKPLSIQVMRQAASDQANKLGALFFNPGGPGESGIEEIQWMALDKELRAKYDIIGFDPRGVGMSSPIRCSDEMDLASYFTTFTSPENEEEAKVNDDFYAKYLEDCTKKNPAWWTTTTNNTVKDMDILRQVITGDKPLNFMGSSYGTTLAAEYIRQFPENTGRIVLDSPTSNEGDEYANELVDAKAQYDAFTRMFDKCATDPDCPGTTRQEVEDLLIEARDRAEEGKLSGFAGVKDSPDYPGEKLSSDYLIYEGIASLAYWPIDDAYPEFKAGMKDLETDWNGVFEYYGLSLDGYDPETMERNNSYEILSIVNCMDSAGLDTHTKAEKNAHEKALAKANPFEERFFAAHTKFEAKDPMPGCDWTWLAFDDLEIPDPPDAMPELENESGKQFLLIGSKGDNATPYEFAVRTAKNLNSVLLTYEGTGHAIAYNGYTCVDDKITDYLLTGELPPAKTSCPAE